MSSPYDQVCTGRNQMIIIGDQRIPAAVAGNSTLSKKVADSTPRTVYLLTETVNFVPLK